MQSEMAAFLYLLIFINKRFMKCFFPNFLQHFPFLLKNLCTFAIELSASWRRVTAPLLDTNIFVTNNS